MLDGLRLDAFRRRHDEQRRVDAGGAGQHVVNEALVTGHVDEAQLPSVAEIAVGVAQVDGDAACLLLLEAIGIDAGQRLHQRGLAMVDMASGPDDHDKGSSARRSPSARCDGLACARASFRKPAASSPAPFISARRSQCSASTTSRGDALAGETGRAQHRLRLGMTESRRAAATIRRQRLRTSRSTPSAL